MKRSAASIATAMKWLKRHTNRIGESSGSHLDVGTPSNPELVLSSSESPTQTLEVFPEIVPSQEEQEFIVVDSLNLTLEAVPKAGRANVESNSLSGSLPTNSSTQTNSNSPIICPMNPLPLPIRLIQTPATGKEDGVSLENLIQFSDLTHTFQFNFSIQADYFLSHLHPEAKTKVTFISGTNLLQDRIEPIDEKLIKRHHIRSLVAPLPDRFGTHHSKMMVNFFADESVEIVIMTANLTMLDFGGLTQMCWRSGRLHKGLTTGQGEVFQRDLLAYLRSYKLPEMGRLSRILKEYNFSPIQVELLASTPGKYSTNTSQSGETYGCLKLRQILARNGLLMDQNCDKKMLLAQVSSIASPYKSAKKITSSIFLHVLCPLMFHKGGWNEQDPDIMVPKFNPLAPGPELCKEHQNRFNYQPHILFPTTTNIGETTFGWSGGQAIHFKRLTDATNNQYLQNIKPYLCKWKSSIRQNAPPHSKIYFSANEDWKALDWVLMCSHNLSKQAWGYPMENGEYKIASYELGVFIPGKANNQLIPQQYGIREKTEKTPIELPFDVPPTRYGDRDEPWSYERLWEGDMKTWL